MEYAQVLVKYRRYDKALEQYEELVKIAGRDVKARATTLRDMGDLYEKMGEDDKALATYRKAQGYVKSSNWLYRELEQRIIGVYRRTDRLQEYAEDKAKKWRSPSYDQAMILAALFDLNLRVPVQFVAGRCAGLGARTLARARRTSL